MAYLPKMTHTEFQFFKDHKNCKHRVVTGEKSTPLEYNLY